MRIHPPESDARLAEITDAATRLDMRERELVRALGEAVASSQPVEDLRRELREVREELEGLFAAERILRGKRGSCG